MAASTTRKFTLSKDNTSRSLQSSGDNPPRQGAGREHHWLLGRIKDSTATPDRWDEYWVTAQASYDWSNVGRVTSALLFFTGSSQHIDMGNTGRAYLRPISSGADAWSEGDRTEGDWGSNEYVHPGTTDTPALMSKSPLDPGIVNSMDVMSLLQWHGPTSTLFRLGGKDVKGGAHTNRGFRIYSPDAGSSEKASEFSSTEATDPNKRPYIEIVYEPKSTKPVATLIAPIGSVADGPTFNVGFADSDPDQTISAYELEVRRNSDQVSTWKPGKIVATDLERLAKMGSLVAPLTKWAVGTQQEWRARVWDTESTPSVSDWTAWSSDFTVTGGVPTITVPLQAIGTVLTMAGVRFVASWTHPQGKAIASLRIQLRSTTAIGSPAWEGADNAWDTGDVTPTSSEQTNRQINRPYAGDSLYAGSYSWRVMVTDVLGVASVWAYGTLALTVDWDVADPGAGDNVGYGRARLGFRIVLRAMGANRGPGALRAIIEDASNVGASAYVSAPGEAYFTLPATHPQVGECEPYKTHYAYEQYRNGKWQEMFAGILTDFDATGDDCVVNGMDYIGLLALDVERRSGTKAPADGGAKYPAGTKISAIIRDQLVQAKAVGNSTVGFITIPAAGTPTFQTMGNEVSINASYRQRLEFIRGLIDSQRAGTGNRGRLVCRRVQGSTADETHGYSYEWNLLLDSGTSRPALRMEYGGLIQGFRIQAMGDFAVSVLGIGRETGELKPFYKTGTSPGLTTAVWGNLARVAVWQDIDDENDLKRRVDQLAAESGRIGKRMALGLRVHGLGPFDGWDLTDSVPIDIVRGVVDTGHYAPDVDGLSWWTIWGTEWRLSPDQHDELTLVVRPREDALPPDPDLVVSKPFVPTPEWTLGHGAPVPATMAALSLYYMDADTGDVYALDEGTGTYALEGSLEGPEGPPGPSGGTDTTPPGAPTALVLSSGVDLASDGTVRSWLGVSWTAPADTDLGNYEVQWSATPWAMPHSMMLDASFLTARLTGVSAYLTYTVRVRTIDTSGNVSAWSAEGTIIAPGDPFAPNIPSGLTATAGFELVGLSWLRETLADLARYQVRWCVGDASGPPAEPDWTVFSTNSTSVVVTGLDAGDPTAIPPRVAQPHWFQLRAVDTSNQTVTSALDPTPVDVDVDPEAGWCPAVTATPSLVGVAHMAVDTLVANFLKSGVISADQITSGTFDLGAAGQPPSFTMHRADGAVIATWSVDGLLIIDPDRIGRAIWLTAGNMEVTNAYDPAYPPTDLVHNPSSIWTNSVTAEGINATAITFGSSPGGHNALPNSGFELTPFAATVTRTWTAAADWGAFLAASNINVVTTGADLTLTVATY